MNLLVRIFAGFAALHVVFVAFGAKPTSLLESALVAAVLAVGWCCNTRLEVLAIAVWMGAILAPLDWDVWYQHWPLPSTALSTLAIGGSELIRVVIKPRVSNVQ